jgi:endonuclease YncB( thermonuclease family)
LFFILFSLTALPAGAETVSGEARVIDGDSIVVGGTRIRIWGIDAPEMGSRAGDEAKKYLKMLVDDAPVRCEDDGTRLQGRIMAKCFIGTVDLGGVMVLSGNANDWRRYSRGLYSRMLKTAGITPRRRQVARRAKPIRPKRPKWAEPRRVAPVEGRPARVAPAFTRPFAATRPTAPAIVVQPPEPFRPAPVSPAAPKVGPAAQPPVSAAPIAPVSTPTALVPPQETAPAVAPAPLTAAPTEPSTATLPQSAPPLSALAPNVDE